MYYCSLLSHFSRTSSDDVEEISRKGVQKLDWWENPFQYDLERVLLFGTEQRLSVCVCTVVGCIFLTVALHQ